jgi:hypothetical protein
MTTITKTREVLQELYSIREKQCGNIPPYKTSIEASALTHALKILQEWELRQEEYAHYEMDMFSAKRKIKELEAEIVRLKAGEQWFHNLPDDYQDTLAKVMTERDTYQKALEKIVKFTIPTIPAHNIAKRTLEGKR